jgi:hypothetical protein
MPDQNLPTRRLPMSGHESANAVRPRGHYAVVRAHLARRRTLRLRAFEARMRRRARRGQLNVYGLAELAGVPSVLGERGIDTLDARPAVASNSAVERVGSRGAAPF